MKVFNNLLEKKNRTNFLFCSKIASSRTRTREKTNYELGALTTQPWMLKILSIKYGLLYIKNIIFVNRIKKRNTISCKFFSLLFIKHKHINGFVVKSIFLLVFN